VSRVLRKAVLVGGVILPAGREVSDEVAETITADVFEPAKAEKAQEKAPAKRAAKKSGS
jgi:hypothetical protein